MAKELIYRIKKLLNNNRLVRTMDKNKENIEEMDEQNTTAEAPMEDQESNQESPSVEAELSEMKDKYIRLVAEFENFKKRTIKEKLDMLKNAAQETIKDLIPVLDDLDRAKKAAEESGSTEQYPEGIALIHQKMVASLSSKGLTVMDTTGQDFDPERHEAITDIPAPTEDMKGKVIDTIEVGYTLNDKIIRFPKVVVGK